MSGIFIDGRFHENTGLYCRRCGTPVWTSEHHDYSYQCLVCDEDMYSFEVEAREPEKPMKVIAARLSREISPNSQLEYVLNKDGDEIVFESEEVAKQFLTLHGSDDNDMKMFYYIEFENEPNNHDVMNVNEFKEKFYLRYSVYSKMLDELLENVIDRAEDFADCDDRFDFLDSMMPSEILRRWLIQLACGIGE